MNEGDIMEFILSKDNPTGVQCYYADDTIATESDANLVTIGKIHMLKLGNILSDKSFNNSYIYTENGWRTINTQSGSGGDMSNYYTKTETDAIIEPIQLSAESAQTSAQEAQTAAEQARVDVSAESAAREAADYMLFESIADISKSVDRLYLTEEHSYNYRELTNNGTLIVCIVADIERETIIKPTGFDNLVFSVRKNKDGEILKAISSEPFYPTEDYKNLYLTIRKNDSTVITESEYANTKIVSKKNKTKEEVSEIIENVYIKNEADLSVNWVNGDVINFQDGDTTTSGVGCRTGLIDISAFGGGKLTYTALDYLKGDGTQGTWASHAFYTDKDFYGGYFISARRTEKPASNPSYQTITVDIPKEAKYVAFTFLMSVKTEFEASVYVATPLNKDFEALKNEVDVIENKITKKRDSFIGSPQKYVSSTDTGNASINLSTLYSLWDSLASEHSDYITRKDDIGTSQINGLKIRHYTVGLSKYMCSAESSRDIKGTNSWVDKYDMSHFVLTTGVHGDEKGSVYGLYLFIKELLEKADTEEWANFILCNSILEIIPCSNPNGYNTGVHGNGVIDNLNRDYNSTSPQAETIGMKTFLESMNFNGLIDLHNDGIAHDYLVAKSSYPDWDFYTQMSAKYSTMFFKAHKENINEQYFPYYEIWDASSATGQIHDYATNKLGIPSISVECRGWTDFIPTKNQLGNYLQMFIQRYS